MTSPEPGGPETEELVARASSGDEAAWRSLIGLYGRRVYAMARSRLRSDDLAEEVTQSVFATVATKLGSGGYREAGRFEAWLFRVAMNRVRDEVRRRRRGAVALENSALDQQPGAMPADGPDAELISGLRAGVQGLNDADRAMIDLRYQADLSFKQIADVLGEPLGTVLARHHRALGKLRKALEQRDGA